MFCKSKWCARFVGALVSYYETRGVEILLQKCVKIFKGIHVSNCKRRTSKVLQHALIIILLMRKGT